MIDDDTQSGMFGQNLGAEAKMAWRRQDLRRQTPTSERVKGVADLLAHDPGRIVEDHERQPEPDQGWMDAGLGQTTLEISAIQIKETDHAGDLLRELLRHREKALRLGEGLRRRHKNHFANAGGDELWREAFKTEIGLERCNALTDQDAVPVHGAPDMDMGVDNHATAP
jgi:hypothetical protein